MKKLLFPILALVLALGLALPLAANTEGDPFVTDLIAGQHIDVGDVLVWDDGTNLYIQYAIDDPWVMTQSHLHIATSIAGIPQTKIGNPIPGQFEWGEYYAPPVDADTFNFDLSEEGWYGEELYIAAHAVVVQLVEDCMDVVSDVDVEWSADGTTWSPTVACWVHPSWNDVAGATWVWRTEYTDVAWEYDNVPLGGWYFEKEFTIPGEPISGAIAINADNTYSLSLNGVYVGAEGSMHKDGPDNHEWGTIDTFPLTNLNSGPNTIEVRALNFFRTGSSTSNPAGLAFNAEVCYQDIIAEETAWGDGPDFPGRNWATYFTYNTPCAEPSGSLSVTGTGWISDSAWCPCNYTYDLTTTGEPVALQGFVDTSAAALANMGDWSKYYAKFSLWDSGGKVVEVVFNNDWLGAWYEMDAQQWDRIRMENNMSLPQPEQWYATVGGVLGYDMSGNWVGPGNGATVFPSDRTYFFQLIADPDANTFTLQVYGMGSSAPDNPPVDWPKQNMFDEDKWLEIGIIDVGEAFDFEEVNLCAILWASTQAGATETSTIYWDGMSFGVPLTFGETP